MAAASAAFSGASNLGSAYVQSKALKNQGQYQKRIADLNAQNAEFQARGAEEQALDAEKRGMQSAARKAQETRALQGKQRAAIAADGGDPNSPENQDILNETASIGAADEAAIKTNAWREAMGFTTQANALRGEAVNATLRGETMNYAAQNQARSTMITGATEATSKGIDAYGEVKKKKAAKKKGEP